MPAALPARLSTGLSTTAARPAVHLLVCTALTLLLAVTLLGQAPEASAATRARQVSHALDITRNQKGDPYRYGAEGPHRFDCSGLVYFSFRRAGVSVPRTSGQLARASHRVKRSNMRKGDLVFFTSSGGVYHVGVFAGWRDGRRTIIHASRPGTPVRRAPIWTNRWFAGSFR